MREHTINVLKILVLFSKFLGLIYVGILCLALISKPRICTAHLHFELLVVTEKPASHICLCNGLMLASGQPRLHL
jgi:hypothetical protein